MTGKFKIVTIALKCTDHADELNLKDVSLQSILNSLQILHQLLQDHDLYLKLDIQKRQGHTSL